MNKSELVLKVAEKTGLDKEQVTLVLEAMVTTIRDSLAAGENVSLQDLGKFHVNQTKAVARNPRTGKTINIPGKKSVIFLIDKALENFTNEPELIRQFLRKVRLEEDLSDEPFEELMDEPSGPGNGEP